MKQIKNLTANFIIGAVAPKDFPKHNTPEIAFSGRSNVGKSSLLNSIVRRKNLAHTSSTPGKTQEINFYYVAQDWSFADLPGFGYAAIGKEQRVKWEKLNFTYLKVRENLRLVCALIDSRHDPMPKDLELLEWLENNQKNYIVILTKCDKISNKLIAERKEQLENYLSQCSYAKEVLPYSSVSGLGRMDLLAIIKNVCKKRK